MQPDPDESVTLYGPAGGDGSATFSWDPFWIRDTDGAYLAWKSGSEEFDLEFPFERADRFDHRVPHSHTVDGLANGTEYTFAIIVFDDDGNVYSMSNEVTFTPTDTTAPVLTSAVVSAGGSILLDFDDLLDASSLPAVSAFAVSVDGAAAVAPFSVTLDDKDGSVLLVGAATGAVAAGATVTIAYTAPASNPLQNTAGVAVTAGTWPVPNRAAAPVASVVSLDGALRVEWSAPADGGSAITGYQVQTKLSSDDNFSGAQRAGGAARSLRLAGLANGTSYDVRVRAVNGTGEGPWSVEVSAVPAEPPVPLGDAASTHVDADNRARVVIGFGEPLDRSSVPGPSAFAVTVGTAAAVAPFTVTVPNDDPDTAGVDESTTVMLVMSADIEAGAAVSVAYTRPASGVLRDLGGDEVAAFTGVVVGNVPAAPGPLAAESRSGRIRVTWPAVTADGGSGLLGYEVQFRPGPGVAWVAVSDSDHTDEQVLVTGLEDGVDGVEYPIRVRARNAVGGGPWAEITAATDPPPRYESESAAVTDGGASITLTFSEPLDDTSVPLVTAFSVTREGGATGGGAPTGVTISADTVTLAVSPAIAAGTRVLVAFEDPTEAFAGAPTLRDLQGDKLDGDDDGVPGGDLEAVVANVPAAPAATLTPGSGRLTVAWDEPADAGYPITGYQVQYKLSSAADTAYTAVTVDPATATSTVITGLTDGTSYDVRVRAVTAAGEGPWTTATETPDTVIAKLASVWAFPGHNRVLVRWTPPEGITDDANLLGYEIQWKSGTQTYSTTDRNTQIGKTDSDENPLYERRMGSLTNDTEYTFRVRLRATTGTGLWSNEITATPVASGTPDVAITPNQVLFPTGFSAFDNPGTRDLLVEYRLVHERLANDVGDVYFRSWLAYVLRLNRRVGDRAPITGVRVRVHRATGCRTLANGYRPDHPGVLDQSLSPYSDAFEALNGLESLHADADPDGFGDDAYPAFEFLNSDFNGCNVLLSAVLVNANGANDEYEEREGEIRTMNLDGPPPNDTSVTLRAPVAGDGSATFSWDPFWLTSLDAAYLVWKSGTQEFDTTFPFSRSRQIDHRAPHSQTVDGLANGTEYTFAVMVFDDDGFTNILTDVDDVDELETVTVTPMDTTAPVLESAVVAADGSSIRLDFDDLLDAASLPAASRFTVNVGTAFGVLPAGVAVDGADSSVLVLTMAGEIAAGDTVSVVYSAPTASPLQNAGGVLVVSDTWAVVNRLAAPGSVRAFAGHGRVDVEWDAAASASGYRVQWKASGGDYSDTASADVAAGVLTYAITGLADGDAYTARVAALNDADVAGAAAESTEVTVGRPGAVRNLVAAPRNGNFRVSFDAPVERGEGFAQDDDGDPVLVYRVGWSTAGQDADHSALQRTCPRGVPVTGFYKIIGVTRIPVEGGAVLVPEVEATLADGVEYSFFVEARFEELDPAGDPVQARTQCVDQTGFGEQSAAAATVATATVPAGADALVRAAVEELVDGYDEQWPWMRTAWDSLAADEVTVIDAQHLTQAFVLTGCPGAAGDVLRGCSAEGLSVDLDWADWSEESFAYIATHELAHVWTASTDLHDAATRSPVGRSLLYSWQQSFRPGSNPNCPSETLADIASQLVTAAPDEALPYTSHLRCYADRQAPNATDRGVVTHALHPSGTSPGGATGGAASTWLADTYSTSADAWTAVKNVSADDPTGDIDRIIVVNLLQDEFGGYCTPQAAKQAAFTMDSPITSPWEDGGCAPDAPVLTATQGTTPGTIDLAWTVDPGGAPIALQTVQWRTAAQTWEQAVAASQSTDLTGGDARSWTIPDLTPGESYTVRLRAVNVIGTGEFSAETTAFAGAATAPGTAQPPPDGTGDGTVIIPDDDGTGDPDDDGTGDPDDDGTGDPDDDGTGDPDDGTGDPDDDGTGDPDDGTGDPRRRRHGRPR